MAGYGRTGLICSLLRCMGRRRSSPCFTEMSRSDPALRVSSAHFSTWTHRHTWSAESVLKVNAASLWTSQRRALTSEAPYKDEYPPLPEYSPTEEPQEKEVFIIRVKGLPWSCTAEDLANFFSDCQIRAGLNGIHLTYSKNGKPNGQAFIELEHEKDISKALEKHRQYLGPRYLEVYEVTNKDAEAILKGTEESPSADGVVRLRGLPFHCTEKDVVQFFSGLDIVNGGVTIVQDNRGRSSGDAFVRFATQEMADQALQRDREVIGNRYIEVFPSQKSEIHSLRGRGDASGTVLHAQRTNSVSVSPHHIHMRGLPYQATAGDVVKFFYPIRVAKVLIEYGPDARPSGKADAYFSSHEDAVAAMVKDRKCIQERYIELFLNSSLSREGI